MVSKMYFSTKLQVVKRCKFYQYNIHSWYTTLFGIHYILFLRWKEMCLALSKNYERLWLNVKTSQFPSYEITCHTIFMKVLSTKYTRVWFARLNAEGYSLLLHTNFDVLLIEGELVLLNYFLLRTWHIRHSCTQCS